MKLQDFFTDYVIYPPLSRQELEEQLDQANAEIEKLELENQQLKRTLQLWRDYHQRAIAPQPVIAQMQCQRQSLKSEKCAV